MKYKAGILLIILFGLYSCNSLKKDKKEIIEEVFGTVQSIENGKDGYTAKIKTSKDEIYFATISIPNLGENGGYERFEIGNKIAIKGEFWNLGEENHITVRKILSSNTEKFEVHGVVQSIENGKDGYTAEIKTSKDEIYFVTISIPNLGEKNAHKFKQYSKGDKLSVVGEFWSMSNEKRITVRDILSVD